MSKKLLLLKIIDTHDYLLIIFQIKNKRFPGKAMTCLGRQNKVTLSLMRTMFFFLLEQNFFILSKNKILIKFHQE